MDTRFDQMTKILAAGIPRREALWRLAGLFGGALLASRAFAGPNDLGCECKNIPRGFDVEGGFGTQTACEQVGIPKAYAEAVKHASDFCTKVYHCLNDECPN